MSRRTDSARIFWIGGKSWSTFGVAREKCKLAERKTKRKTFFSQIVLSKCSANCPCMFFCRKNDKRGRKMVSEIFNIKIQHRTMIQSRMPTTWSCKPNECALFYNVQMDAAVVGNRLPEVTQMPFLGPGSLSSQCRHCESSKVLAGLAFCEMLSQYPQSAFQGCRGSPGGVSSSLRPKPSASICSV